MKNIYNTILKTSEGITFLLLLFAFFSCERIEVETPSHLLGGNNVYTDPTTVEAAIIGIYANLRDYGLLSGGAQGMSNLMGQYADELDYYSAIPLPEESFNKNNLTPSEPAVAEIWNSAYNQIYSTNAILEGVAGSDFFSEEEKAEFTGEALFIRGLLHFYLLNLYGDIPYIKTTNYIVNKSVSRMAESDVYALITADLLEAAELLPETDSTGEHTRPNKYTALALLARVYLYQKNYELANQYASLVIENNGWEDNIANVFLNSSRSTLWQFSPGQVGGNTLEADTFIILSAPPSTRALSSALVNAFSENDLRKTNWIGVVTDGNNSWYFPYKYKIGLGAGSSQEYSIIFRMAEQYIIRAEANTRLGNIAEAQNDINKIRNRAGLDNTTATTESELLIAILQERQLELFIEFGHRFFDLKRVGKLDEVLDQLKPGWNTTDRLFPLPERELVVNPNLQPQNPGY
ncbi:RagB/SusD family nutrient uptake outer membrane protein [Aequorivita sp. F47161]|uniref:RagB/SusD family nutrient uptake outer membrane protein n=1 Tax=Aequorivita vitellina TaxID=2874475 RepID=A0A9X1U2D0_9FLAO|nr:RagB/SusD family nutrient uptake outer membrane protein [Aequorivita vitellina]MCG2419750.1 RagB/SusD family nutrient uptake outer membrane protein [Aequorivita vitellina]